MHLPAHPSASEIKTIIPGLVLTALVTFAATVAEEFEVHLWGRAWLEGLVIAILLGTLLRSVGVVGARCDAGIHFSAKFLLEVAVMLLGVSVSAASLYAAGLGLLGGIAAIVVLAIFSGILIGRLLGLPRKLALLIACGNAICGNSAIAAVAPVIDADSGDVAAAIAFTAVLGVGVVIGLPLLAPVLSMSNVQYGVFAGLTVYAVPQVLAATAPVAMASVHVGTLVKLVRVLMLGPVIVTLSLLQRRNAADVPMTQATAGARAAASGADHPVDESAGHTSLLHPRAQPDSATGPAGGSAVLPAPSSLPAQSQPQSPSPAQSPALAQAPSPAAASAPAPAPAPASASAPAPASASASALASAPAPASVSAPASALSPAPASSTIPGKPKEAHFSFSRFLPWFIIGFVALLALRSAGVVPHAALAPIQSVGAALTLMSMAALGLSVDVRNLVGAGPRVVAAVTLSLLVLGVFSFACIRLLGIA